MDEKKGPLPRPKFALDGVLGTLKQHTSDGIMPVLLDEIKNKRPQDRALVNHGILITKLKRTRTWDDVKQCFDNLLQTHEGDHARMYEQILYMRSDLIEGLYRTIYDITRSNTPFICRDIKIAIKAAEVYFHFHPLTDIHVGWILVNYRNNREDTLTLLRWMHQVNPRVLAGHTLDHALHDEVLVQFLLDHGAEVIRYNVDDAIRNSSPRVIQMICDRGRDWTLRIDRERNERWMERIRLSSADEVRELVTVPYLRRLTTRDLVLDMRGAWYPPRQVYRSSTQSYVQAGYAPEKLQILSEVAGLEEAIPREERP